MLPWDLLLSPILEHYPKPSNGRRPIGVLVMLRVYFMQQLYALSDPVMEDSLYDMESMRRRRRRTRKESGTLKMASTK